MRDKVFRPIAVAAAAVAATALAVQPAQAAPPPAWTAITLPLPPGAGVDFKGYLDATDGKSEFTGSFILGAVTAVVSWRDSHPVVRGTPAGFDWTHVSDENSSGVVLLDASGSGTNVIAPFTLDPAGFHQLPAPAGFEHVYGTAINQRGDVLGVGIGTDDAHNATILWPAGGGTPTVIQHTHAYEAPQDLDDDGTILSDSVDGSFLWKDGVTQPLVAPPGYYSPTGLAIHHGVVTGTAVKGTVDQAMRWVAPAKSVELPGGSAAGGFNDWGMTIGYRDATSPSPVTPTAWIADRPVGDQAPPAGYKYAATQVVAGDGTIGGIASTGAIDEGGHPVLWHYRFP